MKIAFLHYHLKPGGVTTVINQQIDAIKNECDVLVISGETPETDVSFKTIVIPEIGYDPLGKKNPAPEKTAQKIIRAISDHWPSGCDILHVHNPLLAKNRQFLNILSELQERQVRLLLQVHDLAEDGRPRVYYGDAPYPSDCHFCVINSRDYHSLLNSGLRPSGLHLLLNMVTPFDTSAAQKIEQDFILYPVRAIRRKNIGEAILLSLFFPKNRFLAITLPPNSAQDWIGYNDWKQFAAHHHLNILFEASETHHFIDLVFSAKSMVTTSIAEGFGFSYLEPWTAGQMLNGRQLPDICTDFKDKGLILDHMYEKMAVPLSLIDLNRFYTRWKSCILDNAQKFALSIPESLIAGAFEDMQENRYMDFAILDEHFQKQVISEILSNPRFKSRFLALNPLLPHLPQTADSTQKISHNRRIVESQFDRNRYQKQLLTVYRKVMDHPVTHHIDKPKLAARFLDPAKFSLLNWSEPNV